MPDGGPLRLGRELFIAALGMPVDQIDPWAVDRLTSLLEEVDFNAGEVLYREGESAESFYFMQDGHVRMSRENGPSWIMRGRWAVGATEAVLDTPRTFTATAVAAFRAMRVAAGPWVELLEDSFQIARAAVLNVGRATALLEERIPEMALRASRPREHLRSRTPLSLVERLALLVDVRMLQSAGVQSLVDLAATTREAVYESGAIVLPRGSVRSDLLVVVEGEVRGMRSGPDVVRHYGPGDVVLGAASYTQTSPAWEATTVAQTRILSFPIELWFDLMAEHFDLVRSVLAALSWRRDSLLEHLATSNEGLVLT